MSGGLTPCRQLRPSSRREHVKASKSYMESKKKEKKKEKEKETTHKSGSEMTMKCQFQWWRKLVEVEVEWGFYALSASKAIIQGENIQL